MAIQRCSKGHIYDSDMHASCPNCQGDSFRIDFGTTQGFSNPAPGFSPSAASGPAGGIGRTEAAFSPTPGGAMSGAVGKTMAAPGGFVSAKGPGKTQAAGLGGAVLDKDSDKRPVVGWLVCISGANAGRSYELHSDNNYLGSEEGDIIIPKDRKISRHKHMRISYDEVERAFFVSPEAGSNIIRLNGRALIGAAQIYNYDRIETGDSKFMFIAFCSERFGWDDME